MHRYLWLMALSLAVVPCSSFSYAEDYSECRLQCDQNLTDCLNEPQAQEPEVQEARQAACSQKFQSCYAECENFRPRDEVTPESYPNIIRK